VRGNSSRAERYRKLAVKYHELGKFARPAYLGDFYRGVAVRYTFMAQEASERAKREIELRTSKAELLPSTTGYVHERQLGWDHEEPQGGDGGRHRLERQNGAARPMAAR
jgi:hypothetical protein